MPIVCFQINKLVSTLVLSLNLAHTKFPESQSPHGPFQGLQKKCKRREPDENGLFECDNTRQKCAKNQFTVIDWVVRNSGEPGHALFVNKSKMNNCVTENKLNVFIQCTLPRPKNQEFKFSGFKRFFRGASRHQITNSNGFVDFGENYMGVKIIVMQVGTLVIVLRLVVSIDLQC